MLLSEGLSKLNKKAAWDSGIKNSVSMQDQRTQYGELYSEKKLQGSLYENWDTLPRHMLSQKRVLAPTKSAQLIPLGGGGSSLI